MFSARSLMNRRALAVAAVALSVVAWASPASAQLSNLGNVGTAHGALARGTDPQHDPSRDVYLVVSAYGSVTGIFVNQLGVPVTAPFTIKSVAGEYPFAAYPRAKYSPHVNNGAGGFLVTWSSEDGGGGNISIRARVVAYPGTLVGSESVVSTSTSRGWLEAAPAIAYSSTSKRFLIAWQGLAPYVIQSRLVGIDAAPIGDVVALSPGYGRDPGVAWNPVKDEFGVSYSAEYSGGAHSAFVLVPATNPAAFTRTSFNFVSGGLTAATDVEFNPNTGRFVMAWYEHVKARVAEIDQAGTVVSHGVASLTIGTYDGLSLAFNPVSRTFLLVGTNPFTDSLDGAELNANGVRLAGEVAIAGAKALYTRVGASQTSGAWMTTHSRSLVPMLRGVQTGTTSGPPPPPADSRIVALAGDMNFGSVGVGGSVSRTLTISNTGNTALTVTGIASPRGFSGNFSGTIAAGASQNVTFIFSPATIGAFSGTFDILGNQTSGTSKIAISGRGVGHTLGDFDGDATADIAVYRPSTGDWVVRNKLAVKFGDVGDIPVPGDYNGDRREDIAVYRPSNGTWFVKNGPTIQFGDAGDIPVPADYNGDGVMDIAVYRPSNGTWFVRNQFAVSYGSPGDLPVPADYDGNGSADVAVYRTSNGTWFVRNQSTTSWGSLGDLPVPGDYDGDGRTDVAVYRPSTGYWYVRGQAAVSGVYGEVGDLPVPRDYNGDGLTDIAVFRASNRQWLVRNVITVAFGDAGDLPIPRGAFWWHRPVAGDYDGDGSTDVSVFRPATGQWFVRNKRSDTYGANGDQPVPGDYNGDRVIEGAVYRKSTGEWFIPGRPTQLLGGPDFDPVPGDYDGNGADDLVVFRKATGDWIFHDGTLIPWGSGGDIPVPADYDGDGVVDIAVYTPSTGVWRVRNKFSVQFGDRGDLPVLGDFNGDRVFDIAVYRPSTGMWFVRGQFGLQFGDGADMPVHGDFNGDGRTDIAVYRPSNGMWYVRNLFAVQFGDSTDLPVVRPKTPQ